MPCEPQPARLTVHSGPAGSVHLTDAIKGNPVSSSRQAQALEHLLAAETGVPVEVRWDNSIASAHRPRRWAWHVSWPDGPTVEGMRAKAEQHAALLPGLDPDGLVYQRIVQPRSYALAMLRQVRLGQPPLASHGTVHALSDWLCREPYPERGTAEELALADRLVRRSGGHEHRMPAVLAEHGLDALTGDLDTGNIVPLRRPSANTTQRR